VLDLIREAKTNLKINLANLDLSKYNSILKLASPVSGIINGNLEIEGSTDEPFIRQSLVMNHFKYDKFTVDTLIMFGQYSSGYLILDSLSADINNTSFSLKGYQQFDLGFGSTDTTFMDNPFDFYLKSRDNNMEFIGLFIPQIQSISGDYNMELYLSGTPEMPGLNSGSIQMENGTLLLSRVKDPIENLYIDVLIENDTLTVNRFAGKSEQEQDLLQKGWYYISRLWAWALPKEEKHGILVVTGEMNLQNLKRPKVNLDVNMNAFFVDYFVESTTISVSSKNLKIQGQDTIYITGNISLPTGEYLVNLEQIQKNMYLNTPAIEQPKPYISIDVDVELPGNFVVTSSALDLQNNFKIALRGNLRAIQRAGSDKLTLLGNLETESGKFTSFNQSFNIASGTLDFNNPLRINPEIGRAHV